MAVPPSLDDLWRKHPSGGESHSGDEEKGAAGEPENHGSSQRRAQSRGNGRLRLSVELIHLFDRIQQNLAEAELRPRVCAAQRSDVWCRNWRAERWVSAAKRV